MKSVILTACLTGEGSALAIQKCWRTICDLTKT